MLDMHSIFWVDVLSNPFTKKILLQKSREEKFLRDRNKYKQIGDNHVNEI